MVIVLLPRLIEPGSALTHWFTELRGLTVTAAEPGGPLAGLLEDEAPFTATVLASWEDIAQERPGAFDSTLAHEIGHALGLSHVTTRGNLMNATPGRCAPVLDATQLAAITPPGSARRAPLTPR